MERQLDVRPDPEPLEREAIAKVLTAGASGTRAVYASRWRKAGFREGASGSLGAPADEPRGDAGVVEP